jgi:hypothetical protein
VSDRLDSGCARQLQGTKAIKAETWIVALAFAAVSGNLFVWSLVRFRKAAN